MAFRQAAASLGARNNEVLSADNAIPERHIIINTLRNAAPMMGLKASVIATLDAMLSCLPPKRNHHTVFASNLTLTFRRNGISDRTIRRHAAVLQELGLLIRRDSPNKKRFSRHNSHEGKSLRFGFDLSPLFERLQDIATHAAKALQIRERLDACPQATQFLLNDIETLDDVIAHARTLAPMIGIDAKNYQAAQDRQGRIGAAITVWALMQIHERIHEVGAYFRSITSGKKSGDFDPIILVKRLAASQAHGT